MDDPVVMDEASGAGWQLYNGDSAEVLAALPEHSIDFSVFSPPFSSTYTYSPSDRDLGNVSSNEEFFAQLAYTTAALGRVMKPGRILTVHVANLPMYEIRDGASGRYDFRGDYIRHMISHGFVYHSEITIDKNPQAQAIRTHSKGLLFVQLKRDSAQMWQCWADYLVLFRAPGPNPEPVEAQLTQEEWIEQARAIWPVGEPGEEYGLLSPDEASWVYPTWYGIRETDVLSTVGSRDNDDERHLCPLQLPVIERALKLWTNPGDVVLSPFAGIGSEGVVALRNGRRFVGVELKPSYLRVAAQNLRNEERRSLEGTLFEGADDLLRAP